MVIPICLASDRNYLQHLSVTMASILANKTPSDSIRFYILENAFTETDRQVLDQLKSIADFEIVYIQVKNQILELCPLHKNDRLRIEAYFRLFIPELIPNEDKIIYLDCDIIVRHSLAELYSMDMEDCHVRGVRDISSRRHTRRLGTSRYINSGVLLMNSKKMREDRIHEKFADYISINRDKLMFHDQDVISGVLKDRIKYIPGIWNGQVKPLPAGMEFSRLNHAFVLHYIGGKKPWLPYKKSTMAEEYFKYLRLTPFAGYEKSYRIRRLLWRLSRMPLSVTSFIYSWQNSRLRTYRTFRIFGIRFKLKRKLKW